MNITGIWDQLIDCICRPPRDEYTLEDLLGQREAKLMVGNVRVVREDVELTINGQVEFKTIPKNEIEMKHKYLLNSMQYNYATTTRIHRLFMTVCKFNQILQLPEVLQIKINRDKGYIVCYHINDRGLKICASHFKPIDLVGEAGLRPCVIYCHCNSGSRREAEDAVMLLLPQGISVFAFDFTGSGLSEGQYVSLGAYEISDLECVIHHLKSEGSCSTIALWGRSMGAVTTLLYCSQHTHISGIVVDSPFSRLTTLMMEIADEYSAYIPKAAKKMAVQMMRRSIYKKCNFDIENINPVDQVKDCLIPAIFLHGRNDSFVNIQHTQLIYKEYGGDKKLCVFQGEHNSQRELEVYNKIYVFLYNTLRVKDQNISNATQWTMYNTPGAKDWTEHQYPELSELLQDKYVIQRLQRQKTDFLIPEFENMKIGEDEEDPRAFLDDQFENPDYQQDIFEDPDEEALRLALQMSIPDSNQSDMFNNEYQDHKQSSPSKLNKSDNKQYSNSSKQQSQNISELENQLNQSDREISNESSLQGDSPQSDLDGSQGEDKVSVNSSKLAKTRNAKQLQDRQKAKQLERTNNIGSSPKSHSHTKRKNSFNPNPSPPQSLQNSKDLDSQNKPQRRQSVNPNPRAPDSNLSNSQLELKQEDCENSNKHKTLSKEPSVKELREFQQNGDPKSDILPNKVQTEVEYKEDEAGSGKKKITQQKVIVTNENGQKEYVQEGDTTTILKSQ